MNALFCHLHAVNITAYSVNVPHFLYPCKPESRIKSESESVSGKVDHIALASYSSHTS